VKFVVITDYKGKVLGVEGREDLARQYSDREIEEYAALLPQ
jgi:hypothetical protein